MIAKTMMMVVGLETSILGMLALVFSGVGVQCDRRSSTIPTTIDSVVRIAWFDCVLAVVLMYRRAQEEVKSTMRSVRNNFTPSLYPTIRVSPLFTCAIPPGAVIALADLPGQLAMQQAKPAEHPSSISTAGQLGQN